MVSAESLTFPGMTSCFMRPVILRTDRACLPSVCRCDSRYQARVQRRCRTCRDGMERERDYRNTGFLMTSSQLVNAKGGNYSQTAQWIGAFEDFIDS